MVIVLIVFVVVFATVMLCVGVGLSYFRSQQKQQIRSMLQKAEASPAEQRAQLLRPAEVENRLGKLLGRFEFMSRLDLLLKQAGKNSTSSKLVVVSCVLFTAGLLAGSRINLVSREISAGVCALAGLSIPLFLLVRKRNKVFAAFEKDCPRLWIFLRAPCAPAMASRSLSKCWRPIHRNRLARPSGKLQTICNWVLRSKLRWAN